MNVTVHKVLTDAWAVTRDGRDYIATYEANPETFPLDRWDIRNSRGTRLPWDSPIARDIIYAIRREESK